MLMRDKCSFSFFQQVLFSAAVYMGFDEISIGHHQELKAPRLQSTVFYNPNSKFESGNSGVKAGNF